MTEADTQKGCDIEAGHTIFKIPTLLVYYS